MKKLNDREAALYIAVVASATSVLSHREDCATVAHQVAMEAVKTSRGEVASEEGEKKEIPAAK